MKKILIVTEVFYPENGLINDFSKELVKRGYQVDVLTQHPSYPVGKVFDGYKNEEYLIQEWEGIKIHRFKVIEGYCHSKVKKILNYWAFVKKGGKIAKRIGADFDHVLVYQTGPLTLALPAVTIKRRFKTPLTVWTFDIWPDAVYAYGFPAIFPLTTFLNSIIKKVYHNADDILVSSKLFTETISQYAPGKNIDYAPNWLIDEQEQQSTLNLTKGKFNFTFTGNISISQNLENVLKGWAQANISDKASLNIVGDGSSISALKDLVKKCGIQGVVFYGRYPSNQMQSILAQSDMLILPLVADSGISKTEPYKLLSYLKSGKPIYGVINGAARELIEDNALGICANPNCIASISSCFVESMQFVTLNSIQNIRERAANLMSARYDRAEIIERVISYLNK